MISIFTEGKFKTSREDKIDQKEKKSTYLINIEIFEYILKVNYLQLH